MNTVKKIRAVDVGYGNTKYVNTTAETHEHIHCGLFPSIVSVCSGHDLSDGVIAKRNTVRVIVGDNKYEVGPDAELALRTHSSRVLHNNFAETPEYLALLRGALTYMQLSQIDLLVVGLPVSWLTAKSSALKSSLQGVHPIDHEEFVHVEKVLVLAQPVGGLIYHTLSTGTYARLRESRSLVIDPGFFTVDWLVVDGIQPIVNRCGSHPGGTSAVLRKLAESLSQEQLIDLNDLQLLDRALRTGVLNLFGRQVHLTKHLNAARHVTDEVVNAMTNSVGDGHDIDLIVLVGGGAEFYRPAISRRFPRHHVHVVPDAVFANVRGFQIAGEEVMRRMVAEIA
jgi:plasmid segregation protein ParM